MRQVQYLHRRYEEEKDYGVIHRLRGKQSPRRLSKETQEVIKKLCMTDYAGYGPTLAMEKLAERDNIHVSEETLRTYLTQWKLWKPKALKDTQTHRAWRPRRRKEGELIQFDGSYHDWFSDGTERCLLAAIDDATGAPMLLLFEEHEGVLPVFRFWKTYVEEHGKPHAIYHDRFSTYRVNAKKLKDDEDVRTQFVRALGALDMQSIAANSPQAKGRVERLFGTLQDRLVKELKLRGLSDTETANRFLAEEFLPWYKKRFGVPAQVQGDAHRACSEKELLLISSIFSRHDERIIQNDFTIRYKNAWFQLAEVQPCLVRPKTTVIVEEWTDKTLHVRLGKHELVFTALPKRPAPRWERSPLALTTHPPEKESRKVSYGRIKNGVISEGEERGNSWKKSNAIFFDRGANTKDKNT